MSDEIGIHLVRDEGRTGRDVDLVVRNVRGDHAAKLLGVVLKVPVNGCQRLGLAELGAHVAREVGLAGDERAVSLLEGQT